jgi:hypothetical protein
MSWGHRASTICWLHQQGVQRRTPSGAREF